MELFKKAIRFVLFTILFIVVSLIILKSPYPSNDRYEPTISINEVENLSNTEIVEKLLIMYLEHYKAKPIFDDQRIKDCKIIDVEELYAVDGGIGYKLEYLVGQHFWNDYWEKNRRMKDGMAKEYRFAKLIKEEDQFKLKLLGTAPLHPPHPKN
jgi:hypothetical protein